VGGDNGSPWAAVRRGVAGSEDVIVLGTKSTAKTGRSWEKGVGVPGEGGRTTRGRVAKSRHITVYQNLGGCVKAIGRLSGRRC